MIHPTALIDSSAQLGKNVQIGAFSVIEAGVEIGDDCILHPQTMIFARVKMGRANTIHPGAVLGDAPQDLGFAQQTPSNVELGDGNVIREHVTIHRSAVENGCTRVGNACFLMAGAHLAHDVVLGDRVILANNVLLAGHSQVGDAAFLGGGAVVHQHVRIGRLAILQGLAGVGKDVPPFTLAAEINLVAGLNSVGLKRAGFSLEVRNELKAAFNLIYRSGLNVSQALAQSETQSWGPEAKEFFDFIRNAKKRGICALLGDRP